MEIKESVLAKYRDAIEEKDEILYHLKKKTLELHRALSEEKGLKKITKKETLGRMLTWMNC